MNKQTLNTITSLKHAFIIERASVVVMPMFKWMNYDMLRGAN